MKIRLDEITSEGKEFNFESDGKGKVLTLSDLNLEKYQIDLKITPKEAYYEIKGQATSGLKQLCGKCGFDIDFRITCQMNDMILERPVDPRGSQYSKSGQVIDSTKNESEVVYHDDGVFDLGEYLHEVLALRIPDYPSCDVSDCPRAEETQSRIDQINQESEAFEGENKKSPFDALKGLRLQ